MFWISVLTRTGKRLLHCWGYQQLLKANKNNKQKNAVSFSQERKEEWVCLNMGKYNLKL